MRKSLIIILLIVILGGLGYFAYTKGLVKLDSFKKGDVKQIVLENNSEIIEKKEEIKIDPEQIIHPICFGSYFQIESLINLEVCNKQEQKHPSKNDDGRISASYSTFEDELGNEYENEYGHTSYRILSQKDNVMVIAFIDNPGGSSTTTAILIYEKQGNILKLKN